MKISIAKLYREAMNTKIISYVNSNDIERARYAYRRNLKEPGDCAGDYALLAGLAIAEAYIGRRAGWIPETQKLGVKIAELVK